MKETIKILEHNLWEKINVDWVDKMSAERKNYIAAERAFIFWMKESTSQMLEMQYGMVKRRFDVIMKRMPNRDDFRYEQAYINAVKQVEIDYNLPYYKKQKKRLESVINILKQNNEWHG